MEPAIVLYDGDCGFCTRSVLFVFRRDKRARFRFASLQSERGRALLRERGLDASLDAMVLLEGGRAFVRSTAALRVSRGLPWPWSWWGALGLVVPRAARDAIYRWVAKHRRRFAPSIASCAHPSPELRARMLE